MKGVEVTLKAFSIFGVKSIILGLFWIESGLLCPILGLFWTEFGLLCPILELFWTEFSLLCPTLELFWIEIGYALMQLAELGIESWRMRQWVDVPQS